jgi:hypothetical protein
MAAIEAYAIADLELAVRACFDFSVTESEVLLRGFKKYPESIEDFAG